MYFKPHNVKSIIAIIMLIIINTARITYAESKVFSGTPTSILLDKSCDEKPPIDESIIFVLDKSEGKLSGWFYGKGTSAAEFRQISGLKFEIIYPVTEYRKLPSSNMELTPLGDGYKAIIRDHIPEDKNIRKETCFFERLEINLKPFNESAERIRTNAKDLFKSEHTLKEGFDLLFSQYEYKAAQAKGLQALDVIEQIYGKSSKEALNADALIAFALMGMERFDEALKVIEPYHKIFPDHKLLKEFEELLQNGKKEQDDLFRYDPNMNDNVDLEPLAKYYKHLGSFNVSV